jgi:hypothetical protein
MPAHNFSEGGRGPQQFFRDRSCPESTSQREGMPRSNFSGTGHSMKLHVEQFSELYAPLPHPNYLFILFIFRDSTLKNIKLTPYYPPIIKILSSTSIFVSFTISRQIFPKTFIPLPIDRSSPTF